MGLFDYGTRSADDIADLAIFAARSYEDPSVSLPSGWRPLTGAQLGFDSDVSAGSYEGTTFEGGAGFFGAPAAQVYQNESELTLSFRGTDGPVDYATYLDILGNNNYINAFNGFLDTVQDYVENASGAISDINVVGHSLGAAATNILRNVSSTKNGGFFDDATFFGLATPTVSGNPDILNVGFENDWVNKAIARTNPFSGSDFGSTTDNFVLYNDAYASGDEPGAVFEPTDVSAHSGIGYIDAISRVGDSSFYDQMNRDSVVIVSDTDQPVTDKDVSTSDHFGEPAFYVGRDEADTIVGGSAGDFIDAGAGDDTLGGGGGNDTLAGGSGSDLYFGTPDELSGDTIVDLEIGDRIGVESATVRNAVASDSAIFFEAESGFGGIVESRSVVSADVPDGAMIRVADETLDDGGSIIEVTEEVTTGETVLRPEQDFYQATTTDGVIFLTWEREGDLSYPIDVLSDGTTVRPAGEGFEDGVTTIPADMETVQAGGVDLRGLTGSEEDVLVEVEYSVSPADSPIANLVSFQPDTVEYLFVGEGVDDRGGLAFGDPHLTTFDNVAYDFQAAGDFVLARATEGPEYEVQARFTALSSAVSATTAMATSVDGTAISVESNGGDGTLRIGGTATELADGESISVGPGTVSRSGQSIDIDHGNGDETSVDVFDTFLNVVPSPSLARTPGSGEGLLGNADGDPGNEFQLADGTVLSTPVPVETLYGEYAQDWQVAEGNSLLPGPSEPFDAPDRIVTIDSLPENVRLAAEEAVAAANIENEVVREAAILDFALTGNEAFIDAAAQVDESFDPIVDTVPVDPVSNPAIVLTTDRTTLNEEDAAARTATFTVSRGSTDGDLTVNYTTAGVGEAPADASDFAADSGSGQVLIEDGQESASFKVKIADDLLDEGTEAFNTSISLEDDQAPDYEVLVSSVRTTIEDADEGMALNEVRGTDGRDNLRGTDGPDQMISLGGSYDRMAGSAGSDEFIFGAEATNGVRERDVISNFDVAEDSIVLRDGASVAESRERDDTVVLSLDDGNDVAYVRGDGVSLDTVNIVDENLLV